MESDATSDEDMQDLDSGVPACDPSGGHCFGEVCGSGGGFLLGCNGLKTQLDGDPPKHDGIPHGAGSAACYAGLESENPQAVASGSPATGLCAFACRGSDQGLLDCATACEAVGGALSAWTTGGGWDPDEGWTEAITWCVPTNLAGF